MSQTVLAIAPTLSVVDGIPTTTSYEVAQHFGKRHDNVMQAIKNLRDQVGEEHLLNFQEASVEVDQPNGGKATYPAYRLTRDGFTLLAMGFTGKKALAFKLAYIDAFNKMETTLRAAYSVQPGQTLSAEQAQSLRSMIETQAKRHYSDTAVQGRYIKTVWSKLKSHFKVPYRQIPADEFTNAISIVVRHEVEWELVDDEPKASTLNETVAHLVKQLEAPNGAPAAVFMPLVNAVLRKQGFQFLPDSSRMLPSHQADEVLARLNRLSQLFHPFSEQFMDVVGVLRALRGLGPKLGMHEPSYHQVIERIRA